MFMRLNALEFGQKVSRKQHSAMRWLNACKETTQRRWYVMP